MTQSLIDGFIEYRRDEAIWGKDGLMTRLVRDGQKPEYMLISCVDSRTNPGTILKAAAGSSFVFRAPGAIVRPYKAGTALSATLTIAIDAGVSKIIVIGHTGCAAMQHLIDHGSDPEIEGFLRVAATAREQAQACVGESDKSRLQNEAARQAAILSGHNLRSYPAVAQALKSGSVSIDVWLFDMHDGNLLAYDEPSQKFLPLTNFKSGSLEQTTDLKTSGEKRA